MLASMPVVSVVVVNWNAGAGLGRCLASVEDDVRAGGEVIVVDNASTDGSTQAACEGRPWVRTLLLERNGGFACGANAGAAVARGDLLVFLNPDARVARDAIDVLADAIRTSHGVGVAGGGLRDEDGSWQPGAARFGVLRHLLLDTTVGRLASRRRQLPYAVDWVYGTFMAVRRDVFESLGGFDGSYFLYGEDLDLCHRAAAGGWRTLHVPAARAVHGRNVSATTRFGVGREAAVVAGELRFYARRRGAAAAWVYRVIAGGKFAVKAAFATLAGHRATAEQATRVVRVCLGRGEQTAAS